MDEHRFLRRPEPPAEALAAERRARHAFWIDITLGVLSLSLRFMVLSGSQAILAILFDDLLEIFAAIALLVALGLEGKQRTTRFPFGYRRVGTLAGMFTAMIIVGAALYIIWNSASLLVSGPAGISGTATVLGFEFWRGWLLMFIAFVTTLPSLFMYVVEQPIDDAMEWDAMRTHTASHLVSMWNGTAAVVGIALVWFGFEWGDPLAAIVVGLLILWDGGKELWGAIKELIDQSPPKDLIEPLDAIVAQKPYTQDYRWMLRSTGRYIDGTLFVVVQDTNVAQTDEWRNELQHDLRTAEWRIDDLFIVFVTRLPRLPPDPTREAGTDSTAVAAT